MASSAPNSVFSGSGAKKPAMPHFQSLGEKLTWIQRRDGAAQAEALGGRLVDEGSGRAAIGSEIRAERDAYEMLDWAAPDSAAKLALGSSEEPRSKLFRRWAVRELAGLSSAAPAAMGVAAQIAAWEGLAHGWLWAEGLPDGERLDADALAHAWALRSPSWIVTQSHLCDPVERLMLDRPERFLPEAARALSGSGWFGRVLDRWMESNLAICPPALDAWLAKARAEIRSDRQYKELEGRMRAAAKSAEFTGGSAARAEDLGGRLSRWARFGHEGGFLSPDEFLPRIREASLALASVGGERAKGAQSAFQANLERLLLSFELGAERAQGGSLDLPKATTGRRL